ncbi:MAG: hypothetical protein ACLT2V_06630 [Escherichia coli]
MEKSSTSLMIASRLLAERSMVVMSRQVRWIGFQRQAGKADHPIERAQS